MSGDFKGAPGSTTKTNASNREERKQLINDLLDQGYHTWEELVEVSGLAKGAIAQLRIEDEAFKTHMDSIRERNKRIRGTARQKNVVYNPQRRRRKMPDFVTARMEYLGFPTPAAQMPLIEAWEDKTNRTILCLGPTGMGKDTTSEHIVLLTGASDYDNRVAWFMEADTFAKRRVTYGIRPYLEEPRTYDEAPRIPGGRKPTHSLIEDFGPFVWEQGMVYPDGSRVPKSTWNQNELYFLSRDGRRERDPNVWATGLSGTTYGSRIRTMVVSDAFTKENQRNPTQRAQQRELLEGTMKTRLDGGGRRLFINTRVGAQDNNGYFIEKWAGSAKEVAQPADGPRSYTKLRNGVAIVIIQAIQYDADGQPRSFWEENPEFPLHSYYQVGPERIVIEGLTDDQINMYADMGAHRVDGLLERQSEEEDFETMQQQNPPSSDSGEFTDELLDACDDDQRTFGVYVPGEEILIHGVDPAKTYGAGWSMLGYNWQTGVMTVIDFGFHTKLGHVGIREKLLEAPLVEYRPAHLAFEPNREGANLEFPDIQRLIRSFGTKVHRLGTNTNRFLGEAAVSRMAWDMRRGLIRIPAATPGDVQKAKLLKQHFKNYDESTIAQGRSRAGQNQHAPDDVAISTWMSWKVGKALRDARKRPEQRDRPRRPVPASVRRRHRRASKAEPVLTERSSTPEWDIQELMR